jgi:hypothetical protein
MKRSGNGKFYRSSVLSRAIIPTNVKDLENHCPLSLYQKKWEMVVVELITLLVSVVPVARLIPNSLKGYEQQL